MSIEIVENVNGVITGVKINDGYETKVYKVTNLEAIRNLFTEEKKVTEDYKFVTGLIGSSLADTHTIYTVPASWKLKIKGGTFCLALNAVAGVGNFAGAFMQALVPSNNQVVYLAAGYMEYVANQNGPIAHNFVGPDYWLPAGTLIQVINQTVHGHVTASFHGVIQHQ